MANSKWLKLNSIVSGFQGYSHAYSYNGNIIDRFCIDPECPTTYCEWYQFKTYPILLPLVTTT